MTTDQMQDLADRTLRKVALQYGSTTRRDFRVIEIVLSEIGSVPVSASEPVSAQEQRAKESSPSLTVPASVEEAGVELKYLQRRSLFRKTSH